MIRNVVPCLRRERWTKDGQIDNRGFRTRDYVAESPQIGWLKQWTFASSYSRV
jgi:hypothetical protein